MSNSTSILKKYWGYDAFRPMQEEIIQAVLDGKDTLALLPTGGGKSICFQVPGLMLKGVCLVISPLIALMTDQVDQLKKKGIRATALYSGMSKREIDIILDNCVHGQVKFLYVSPERLKSELFIERLKKMNVGLLAIDEAHCISQWGYDFRPSYLEIEAIYPNIEGVKRIALTATATKDVKKDICEKLAFKEPVIFQKSFARKNLSYTVFELENKGNKLIEILTNVQGSAVIYVRSRKETENVSKFLLQKGISSDFYHAGLDAKLRQKKQEEWLQNTRRVIVATNAFGMGIDKPDVRTVIHLDLPDTMEAYYQEAGRAGRDERMAFAVLLYSKSDISNLEKNDNLRHPSLEYVQRIYQAIANFFKLATGSSEGQSYDFGIKEFCYVYDLHAMEVHHAINKLQEMGLVVLNDSYNKSSTSKIIVGQNEVYKYCISNAKYDPLFKAMLRLYGGALYSDFMKISEIDIAQLAKMNKSEVIKCLRNLAENDLIIYDELKTKPQLTYLTPRLESSALKRYYNPLEPRRKVVTEKVKQMIGYAKNQTHCRTRIFQEYFDEEAYLNCGVCDVCIRAKKDQKLLDAMDSIKESISFILKSISTPISIPELKKMIQIKDDFLLTESIRILLDEQKLIIDERKMISPSVKV